MKKFTKGQTVFIVLDNEMYKREYSKLLANGFHEVSGKYIGIILDKDIFGTESTAIKYLNMRINKEIKQHETQIQKLRRKMR